MYTRADAHWFSQTVGALYAATTVEEFTSATMAALDRQFSLHSFAYEELGGRESVYQLHKVRCGSPPPADHTAYFHDFPLLSAMKEVTPPPILHMRHDVRAKDWDRTDHFNGLARATGWDDQIFIVARARPTIVWAALCRDVVFSENEHHLACLLQPHLSTAWMRVQPRSNLPEHGLSLSIALSRELRPRILSADHVRVLRSYFPFWRNTTQLPAELTTWVRHSIHPQQNPLRSTPLKAFAVESVRGRLVVRCFPQHDLTVDLRMIETPAVRGYLQLKECGLTTRECEVLHWIAQGKRDREVAMIAGLAPRTVNKHVENLLRKLGAENRGSAVRVARSRLAG